MIKINQSFYLTDTFIISLFLSSFQRPPTSSWRNSGAHESGSGLFKAQDNSESMVLKQKKAEKWFDAWTVLKILFKTENAISWG